MDCVEPLIKLKNNEFSDVLNLLESINQSSKD